ncbi:molybdenum ABC transporter ATP-binding protein [Pseudothauera nasutitermitis]|uniref:Molybdenum ABC transporter ATP-binding protein n=1 Tax=Pseudothauera nasutitermitis TaxID=2565930 RepID=A0A4S4AYG1_9RHOO|nr:molybdenum ABC transporter ATP-binding protein [Pseudothauera nasutitermitis]THF64706.1 molybdenum ABC transporter ATP-binding protein [Pseudothauera nasutitermitis]
MSIEARFRFDRGDFVLDVDLSLPARGVTALFGRSGSGKTTLLRCVAGLERAPGRLVVDGAVWQDEHAFLPTHKRPLGYVFQEASLFPHLKAAANMRYGMRRTPEAERRVGWDEVVDLLGIGHLLDRYPDALSGGERQRVSLARALLTSPRLLLMDEPLSALDHARKQEILPYLERLHDELDIPVLYVSHSPDEVARLADHVVLMENGRAVASGGLQDTLARLDLPTALAEDAGVVVAATVGAHDAQYNLTRLDFSGGSVFVAERPQALGERLRFRVHARDVSLARERVEGTSITNLLPATVVEVGAADNPAHVLVRLDAEGTSLLARITRRSLDQLGVEPGLRMWAQIKAVALLG